MATTADVSPHSGSESITLARPRTEFRCRACGYGVVVSGSPPACPMCHAERWQAVAWRPFSAAERPPEAASA